MAKALVLAIYNSKSYKSALYSIQTKSLTKKFGDNTAIDDVSFGVEQGEIFGFLGPNGAGKSTTMMILTTLLKPTSGQALVCGYDVRTHPGMVRQNIGYVQQETAVDEFLTGRENLRFLAKLNHIPNDTIDRRIDAVLDLIELKNRQHDAVLTYSGGMRKRLDIAGGLLHMPKVLFLDEPTVGLDIQTRQKIWEYIKKINKEFGTSIFVSTHYMEEADKLCGKVGIIDHGKIQVMDTPQNMKAALGREAINITTDDTNLGSKIRDLPQVTDIIEQDGTITVFASKATVAIPKIFELAARSHVTIRSISMTQPTLDDVFISYTGRNLRESGRYDRKKEHARIKRMGA